MKRFINDITGGLIAFLIFWGIAEWIVVKCPPRNAYTYKYNYVRGNSSIKTLLIGSSYFENGINPYLLGDSVYDFAMSGRRWMYWDAVLAERLFPTMPNLKNVIFPLGYETPYISPHYQPEYFEHIRELNYKYTKYMDCPYDRSPEKYVYYSALLNNKMGVKYWKNEWVDELGYAPISGQCPNWQEMHNVSINIDDDISALCFRESIDYLVRMAKVCYENDIRFVVVTCPCANCYIQNTRVQGVKNLSDLIDRVAAYYPIEYYNYLDDAEFRADSLYYNSSHLNSIGADNFAIRLKNDLGL